MFLSNDFFQDGGGGGGEVDAPRAVGGGGGGGGDGGRADASMQQSLNDPLLEGPSMRHEYEYDSDDDDDVLAPQELRHRGDDDDLTSPPPQQQVYHHHPQSPPQQQQPVQEAADQPDQQASVNSAQARRQRLLQQRKNAVRKRQGKSAAGAAGMIHAKQGTPVRRARPQSQQPQQQQQQQPPQQPQQQPQADSFAATRVDTGGWARPLTRAERELQERNIAPVFDPVGPVSNEMFLDLSDKRAFLSNPLPEGVTLKCEIQRDKSSIASKWYPSYLVRISDEDKNDVRGVADTADEKAAGVFLMAAKRRPRNKTSNYIISMDRDKIDRHGSGYLGKVRSNFVGTEFNVYDKGMNPKEVTGASSSSVPPTSVRRELATVLYESNLMGKGGPRKMTVVLPALGQSFRPIRPMDPSLLGTFKQTQDHPTIMTMSNKSPKWNAQVGAYVLNFNGRVTMASVKNFQLVFADDPDAIILQFGKVDKDRFTMDVQWPLSPLQALGISLTSFDIKLACE